MCRFLFFIILLSSFVFQIGCSGGADGTNSATDVNAVPFAEITDANEALAVGNELLDNNETEKAIDAFLRAAELNPNLAEAYFKLGIAYSLLEAEEENAGLEDANAEPAEKTTDQKASKSNSEIAFKKAIDAYKSMIEQNPDDHLSHYNLGRAYNKLNRDGEAARSLREAVKLNPEDTEYQTELGAILIKLAEYREAIPPLKKALEIDPSNSRAEGLLEDAEAGRKRVDFTPPKKDGKAANSNANIDANSNSATGDPGATGTPKKPLPPANKPSPPGRKPNR